MVTPKNPQVESGLLVELANEEAALGQKVKEWERIRAEMEVARRRYGAVRDAAQKYINAWPYGPGVMWPDTANTTYAFAPYKKGQFRFVDMSLGDAVVAALIEADEALSAPQLIERLANGYLRTNPRALHAAAINTPGVTKDGDVYKYAPPQVEDDDLPW